MGRPVATLEAMAYRRHAAGAVIGDCTGDRDGDGDIVGAAASPVSTTAGPGVGGVGFGGDTGAASTVSGAGAGFIGSASSSIGSAATCVSTGASILIGGIAFGSLCASLIVIVALGRSSFVNQTPRPAPKPTPTAKTPIKTVTNRKGLDQIRPSISRPFF
ncbi:MAG: hypothetical protein ACJAU6_002449 [Alphaproteobacteria bacterium]|jgi:hypothetical protein